jgi:hypothetical protein
MSEKVEGAFIMGVNSPSDIFMEREVLVEVYERPFENTLDKISRVGRKQACKLLNTQTERPHSKHLKEKLLFHLSTIELHGDFSSLPEKPLELTRIVIL